MTMTSSHSSHSPQMSHVSNTGGQAAPISRPEAAQPDSSPRRTRGARQPNSCPLDAKSESVGHAAPPSKKTLQDAWYCKADDGKLYGPIADPLLQRWATEGRISATCQLLQPHWRRWCWASEVFPGLAFPQGKVQGLAQQDPAPPTGPPRESDGFPMIKVDSASMMERYCRRFGIRTGISSKVRVCSVVLQVYFVLNWLCWCGLGLSILAGIQSYPVDSLNRHAAIPGDVVTGFLIVAVVLGSVVSWIFFRMAQGVGNGERASVIGLAVVSLLMLIAATMSLATQAYLIGLVALGTNLVLFLLPVVIACANWSKVR